MGRNRVRDSDQNYESHNGNYNYAIKSGEVLEELDAHWLPLFKRLDDGKSGATYPSVNIRDLRPHHRPSHSLLPTSIVDRVFAAADENRDGILEYREFAKWCLDERIGVADSPHQPEVTWDEVGVFKDIMDDAGERRRRERGRRGTRVDEERRYEDERDGRRRDRRRREENRRRREDEREEETRNNERREKREFERENTRESRSQEDRAPFDPHDGRIDPHGLTSELDERWKPLFERLDDGRSGKTYPAVRLRDLRRHLSREDAGLPTHVVDKVFEAADLDRDGILEYKEFAYWCMEEEMGEPDREGEPDVTTKDLSQFHLFLRSTVGPVLPLSVKQKVSDYHRLYSCCPPPLFMLLVSSAEFAVFVYYAQLLGGIGASTPIPIYSPLIYHPRRRYEAWRFLSYMFLHAGLVHLVFNLLVQLLVGVPLEMVHRWWRVGLIYFLGVIAGSLASSVADSDAYLLGASGGVYAIIWAHLANIILNWKEMKYGKWRVAVLCLLTGVDLGYALYVRFGKEQSGATKVGIAAHFGGGLSGCLVGIFVLRNIQRHLWEDRAWWIALCLYLSLTAFAVFWNAFAKTFPETNWIPLANITCRNDNSC